MEPHQRIAGFMLYVGDDSHVYVRAEDLARFLANSSISAELLRFILARDEGEDEA